MTNQDKVKKVYPSAKTKIRTFTNRGRIRTFFYIETADGAVISKGKTSLDAWKRAAEII